MKKVSIQELKKNLSSLVDEAAAGRSILITRHRRPVAFLSSADLQHLHIGKRFGKAKLEPLLSRATRERYLVVLAEDRRGGGAR